MEDRFATIGSDMRRHTLPLLALLAALPAAPHAFAQDAAATAAAPWSDEATMPDISPVQIALSSDVVQRFVSSIPSLIALSRELDAAQGRTGGGGEAEDDLSFLLARHLFDPKSEQRINSALAGYGFANYAEWANAAHSVAIAAEAAAFGRAEDLGSQKAAALRDVQNDKTLTDETRQNALDEVENQFAALAEFEPLPGNVEAVRPFLPRLKAANGG
jgi:hypothetical protein